MQSPPNATQRGVLDHLLAAHFPAAWNAKGLAKASQAPIVLIGDNWGNGKPRNLFSGKNYINAGIVGGRIDPNPNQLTPSDHGYHVSGIVFGSFANDGTAKGLVTGAFTPRGKLWPVDGQNDGSLWQDNEKFLQSINQAVQRDPRQHVVVNTSLSDGPDADGSEAVKWIKRVRELGLEDNVFHATAAGNDGADGGAGSESTWSAAAVRNDLQDNGTPVSHLTNTLSVENVLASSDASELACLNAGSNSGGSIAAGGTAVRSFNSRGVPIDLTGTSQASPVAAGLAAYLWSIAPDLTPQDLAAAITLNSQPGPETPCTRTSAPLLDAYAATLSLDQPGAPTRAGYKVRMEILDVNNDGRFNNQDLELLARKVDKDLNTSVPTWSRHDLNGDGFTGGTKTAPFDLDRTDSTRAGESELTSVTTTIDGLQATFSEIAATDEDVLCFYAHSPLFTGTDAVRNRRCPPPIDRELAFPDAHLHAEAGNGVASHEPDQKTSEFKDSDSFSDQLQATAPAGGPGTGTAEATQSTQLTLDRSGEGNGEGDRFRGGDTQGEASATVTGSGDGFSISDFDITVRYNAPVTITIQGSISAADIDPLLNACTYTSLGFSSDEVFDGASVESPSCFFTDGGPTTVNINETLELAADESGSIEVESVANIDAATSGAANWNLTITVTGPGVA